MKELTILSEVTEWPDNTRNHLYLFNKQTNKIVAYSPTSVIGEWVYFARPLSFSKSYRKFVVLPTPKEFMDTRKETLMPS
jgi:hypothetical protein